MFKSVLVPLDGSFLAESAIAPAARLLGAHDEARALLLHVTPPGGAPESEDPLARAEAHLGDERLEVERLRSEGDDPAGEILAAIEAHHPDLVAMASHGRGGIERIIRGSVAERVLRSAEVPLLLVNPHTAEEPSDRVFRRILVPLDGSETADRILPYVIAIARSVGAEVTLLRVEPIEPYLTDPLSGVPFVEPHLWSAEAVAETLDPQKQRLLEARVDVTVEAVLGDAASEIAKKAREFDLVALSSHGRSGLSRWWFGSVAEHVLRVVERPLLVVRSK